MKRNWYLAVAAVLWLSGCTTVPDRYARDPVDPGNCGYRVEPTQKQGFALEVFYREFKFFPFPDQPVQSAKECFLRTAERLAKQQGKKIKPILRGDLNAAPTRNTIDGTYAVYVAGRVQYLDEPSSPPSIPVSQVVGAPSAVPPFQVPTGSSVSLDTPVETAGASAGVERLARDHKCNQTPKAILFSQNTNFETYLVACGNGTLMAVRCGSGTCKVVR